MFDSLSSLPQARRWRQQSHPVASVLAIIYRVAPEPRYLLIQRQVAPYAGKWGLVGGRWEFGESLADAITREVEEETGLNTTFVALRGVVNERLAPTSPTYDGAHFLLFVCELSTRSGIASEQAEGPVAWYTRAEMDEMSKKQQIISSDYAILTRFASANQDLAFIEAEVLVGSEATEPGKLVRFEDGPQPRTG